MIGTATQRPLAFSLALGSLGAGALIVTAWNTRYGPLILFPYAALVLVSAIYLRLERVQNFTRRFGITLGVFMSSTLLFYLYEAGIRAKTLFIIPLWGHAWRVGFMLLIGSALSAAVAQLTATSKSR
jgi:hypothetical protein